MALGTKLSNIRSMIDDLIARANNKTGAGNTTLTDAVNKLCSGYGTGSGGFDTSDATATAGDIAANKTAYTKDGYTEGTLKDYKSGETASWLPLKSVTKWDNNSKSYARGTFTFASDRIYRDGSILPVCFDLTDLGDAGPEDVLVGKTFTSSAGVVVSGARLASSGGLDTSDATATTADIVKDKTAYVGGQKITGSLSEGLPDEITALGLSDTYDYSQHPSNSEYIRVDGHVTFNKAVRQGHIIRFFLPKATLRNHIGAVTTGTDTTDATATANDIAYGKTAYVKGEKIEGSLYDPSLDGSSGNYSGVDDYNTASSTSDDFIRINITNADRDRIIRVGYKQVYDMPKSLFRGHFQDEGTVGSGIYIAEGTFSPTGEGTDNDDLFIQTTRTPKYIMVEGYDISSNTKNLPYAFVGYYDSSANNYKMMFTGRSGTSGSIGNVVNFTVITGTQTIQPIMPSEIATATDIVCVTEAGVHLRTRRTNGTYGFRSGYSYRYCVVY